MENRDELLVSRLQRWSAKHPERKGWTFLNDSGEVAESYTYRELDVITSAMASRLLSDAYSLQQGDRVLLVFFPGLRFMISLLACFKAGIVAVPVFPPDPRKLKKDLHHFASIQKSSGAKVALTHKLYNYAKSMAGAASLFSFGNEKWPELSWIPVDSMIDDPAHKKTATAAASSSSSPVTFPKGIQGPKDTDIAFLQYTSGSTSEPKGVMISHANLAHNEGLIVTELKANEDTVNVSWLPQYHDMGLIGSYLGLLYCGGVGVYLSPISFLKDPTIWLRTISEHKGTHTQAPNFAYALSVRKFKDSLRRNGSVNNNTASGGAAAMDLSSLQHMINAAEPVDAMAIMDFYDTFAQYGIPDSVVIPTFGLAEHCVFVCSDGKQVLVVDKAALGENKVKVLQAKDSMREYSAYVKEALGGKEASGGDNSQVIVGCGYPHKGAGIDVRIVNPETLEVLDDGTGEDWTVDSVGAVGEIWVDSPSKALGYWQRPEQSDEEFRAIPIPASAPSSSSYLRTGDLGFYYKRELFICGRIKDVIIVRGSNHYPQDIERTAEKTCEEVLRAGCSAAFSVRDDTDEGAGAGEGLLLRDSISHYCGRLGRGGGKNKGSSSSNTKQRQGSGTEIVVYIAEVKPDVKPTQHAATAEAIRNSVNKDHGLSLAVVLLVEARSVPKTTSGKITRAGCKKQLFSKQLKVVHVSDVSGSSNSDSDSNTGLESSGIEVGMDKEEESRGPTAAGREKESEEEEEEGLMRRRLPVEELTELPRKDILRMVETLLVEITADSPCPLSAPVETDAALIVLGLDSMTINQFKGAIDGQFYAACIPDDFMFTSMATLDGLSLAIKMQGLTAQQQRAFDAALAGEEGGEGGDGDDDIDGPVMQKEPLCPWYTCCY
jgi:acyl-CoA synthetase (AMP-forming)/AMP-acid ligase II